MKCENLQRLQAPSAAALPFNVSLFVRATKFVRPFQMGDGDITYIKIVFLQGDSFSIKQGSEEKTLLFRIDKSSRGCLVYMKPPHGMIVNTQKVMQILLSVLVLIGFSDLVCWD